MGVNAEMLLIRDSDVEALTSTIATFGGSLKLESATLSLPAFPSRPDIRYGEKRTLILVPGSEGWIAIAEGGGVADEALCRGISRNLKTDSIIVGLYEVTNAWALRHYVDGTSSNEIFEPPDAFKDEYVGDSGWSGDSASRCYQHLASVGWPFGILSFQDLIRGVVPKGLDRTHPKRIHLE